MFGASRSVAGSHLINLRRQRASFNNTSTIAQCPTEEHRNPYPPSNLKQYVIPNFALFEFLTTNEQHDNKPQVIINISSGTLCIIYLSI